MNEWMNQWLNEWMKKSTTNLSLSSENSLKKKIDQKFVSSDGGSVWARTIARSGRAVQQHYGSMFSRFSFFSFFCFCFLNDVWRLYFQLPAKETRSKWTEMCVGMRRKGLKVLWRRKSFFFTVLPCLVHYEHAKSDKSVCWASVDWRTETAAITTRKAMKKYKFVQTMKTLAIFSY